MSDWQLRLMEPNEVRERWDWVRGGLTQIIGKTGEKWLPEDVFFSVMAGQSYLYDAGDGQGFVVLKIDSEWGLKYLFCWCAWSDKIGAFDRSLPAMKQLAKQAGCHAIRFESPRDAWIKRAKLVSSTFEIGLEEA